MIRVIDEIKCTDDDGEAYTVHILQDFKIVRDLSGVEGEVPGMKFAVLAGTEGRVNPVDAELNAFQIVENDRIIRRITD